ncbi:MAG: 23S rRNA (guanosine(2251)-2'-O)-methyltransferase RlmB [Bacteroidales bacterium]|nr:23S rRNA (guanosine(2251)-2'-O)-methyltransferase RlmB [Bacteroidales bacterium]
MFKKNDIVYGMNPVLEAIEAGREIEKIFILKTIRQDKLQEIKRVALDRNIPFQFVPKEKLNKLTNQNHQGIIAISSPVEYVDIGTLLPTLFESGKNPFLLILDKVTDVRNLGSIARTAECAGVDAIIIPAKGSALITSDAVKTSAGALSKIPVCRVNSLLDALRFLKDSGVKLFATSEKAKTPYFDAKFDNPTALVMGSEEKGVAEEFLNICQEHLTIPMTGTTQSLNVSVAAGIILFEVVKQRAG